MTPEALASLDPDTRKVLDTILLQQPWRDKSPLPDDQFLQSCYQLMELDLIQVVEVDDTFRVLPNLQKAPANA